MPETAGSAAKRSLAGLRDCTPNCPPDCPDCGQVNFKKQPKGDVYESYEKNRKKKPPFPGEGKGKNWWCVLYPPLCFVDIKDDTAVAVTTTTEIPADREDSFAVKGELFQVKLRSKFLEWLYR